MTDEEEQDSKEEEEPADIQLDKFDEKDPAETAEKVAKKQDVIFSAEMDSRTISPSSHETC